MKIILIILIAIAVLIALFFIVALFIKREYALEREITISKPKQKVFDFIKLTKNQEQYNKWWMLDPNTKMDFKGTDGTAGFVVAWDSENKQAGKGELETKKIKPDERIDFELRFEKPFKGIAYTFMSTESISANETKVKWGFSGKNKYPMNVMNLMIRKVLYGELGESIGNLKNVLEKA